MAGDHGRIGEAEESQLERQPDWLGFPQIISSLSGSEPVYTEPMVGAFRRQDRVSCLHRDLFTVGPHEALASILPPCRLALAGAFSMGYTCRAVFVDEMARYEAIDGEGCIEDMRTVVGNGVGV